MKILRLLNKNFFLIIILTLSVSSIAEEKPVDIWNVDQKVIDQNSENELSNSNTEIKVQKKKRKKHI